MVKFAHEHWCCSQSQFRQLPGNNNVIFIIRECSSITSASFPRFWTFPPALIFWRNNWTEGELLDDLYDKFQIIKIYFSIFIRNIFWGIGAVFKNIRALFRKKFISLLIISSILYQYLLYVSTFRPLPFKYCQHVSILPRPPTLLQSISNVSILAQTPHPPTVLM